MASCEVAAGAMPRGRAAGLPYTHTKTGDVRRVVRCRLDDELTYDKANLKEFTFEVARCKSLDGSQRHEVMETVRLWLRPPK